MGSRGSGCPRSGRRWLSRYVKRLTPISRARRISNCEFCLSAGGGRSQSPGNRISSRWGDEAPSRVRDPYEDPYIGSRADPYAREERFEDKN
eukprot:634094-Rhodomonas_salina.1